MAAKRIWTNRRTPGGLGQHPTEEQVGRRWATLKADGIKDQTSSEAISWRLAALPHRERRTLCAVIQACAEDAKAGRTAFGDDMVQTVRFHTRPRAEVFTDLRKLLRNRRSALHRHAGGAS